jgi:LysM repeat protein
VTTDSLANRNGLNRDGIVLVGQVLNIPADARLAANDPQGASPASLTYVVKAGDTVGRIAGKFSVSIAQVRGWNRLRTDHVITPGQRLVLHVRGRSGI